MLVQNVSIFIHETETIDPSEELYENNETTQWTQLKLD